jgi:hypothetical protein
MGIFGPSIKDREAQQYPVLAVLRENIVDRANELWEDQERLKLRDPRTGTTLERVRVAPSFTAALFNLSSPRLMYEEKRIAGQRPTIVRIFYRFPVDRLRIMKVVQDLCENPRMNEKDRLRLEVEATIDELVRLEQDLLSWPVIASPLRKSH